MLFQGDNYSVIKESPAAPATRILPHLALSTSKPVDVHIIDWPKRASTSATIPSPYSPASNVIASAKAKLHSWHPHFSETASPQLRSGAELSDWTHRRQH